jgi:hypothetical protein
MVLLAAYGNFQDQIVLGRNLPVEPDEPLVPREVEFAFGAFQSVPLSTSPAPSAQKPAACENFGVGLANQGYVNHDFRKGKAVADSTSSPLHAWAGGTRPFLRP